jgi:benzoate membrane transport protein
MSSPSETPNRTAPHRRGFLADFGPTYFANGFIGWLFAATGPVAIILSVATGAKLSQSEIGSWLFGVFFVNGIITIYFCLRYRQPLAFFWTIPGTVLVGTALTHLRFPEVIGAYYATGLLMLLLGATGWVRRAMRWVPMPIVMAMVAGVFLRFGLDLVRALGLDVAVAAPMVVAWLALSAVPALGRRVPPLIGALVVGIVALLVLGRLDVATLGAFELARPVLQVPEWSWPAMIELVVPLAITVLVVQNGQGFAVLKAARHEPPVDAITVACGVGAILNAVVGSISTCLTGPTNAILTSSGERSRQYTAGVVTGALAVVFGVLAPACTRLLLDAPKAFIMALAGLAMLRVLQTAFVASFSARHTLGALVCIIVTIADRSLFNIGAAFWGLVAGFAVSWLMERGDFAAGSAR